MKGKKGPQGAIPVFQHSTVPSFQGRGPRATDNGLLTTDNLLCVSAVRVVTADVRLSQRGKTFSHKFIAKFHRHSIYLL